MPTLTSQCLCKAHTITTAVPAAALPLPARICHCNSCRHSTGAMYFTSVWWPGANTDFLALPLKRYAFSPRQTVLSCATCSSALAVHIHGSGSERVSVSTASLSCDENVQLIRVTDHMYVADTRDGGATPWLRDLHGAPIPLRKGSHTSEELSPDWQQTAQISAQDEIPLYCHCKSVDLRIRRGTYDPADKMLPFFVNPVNGKTLAGFDACHSCRTSICGSDVTNWSFSLLKYLTFADGSPFPETTTLLKESKDMRLASLKYYASSPDVQRYFCSNCSASVFYAVDDRPSFVDVAPGLMDAAEGARADSWFEWDLGEMIWTDDVKDTWREAFTDKIKANAEKYRIDTGREKPWARREKK